MSRAGIVLKLLGSVGRKDDDAILALLTFHICENSVTVGQERASRDVDESSNVSEMRLGRVASTTGNGIDIPRILDGRTC